jgi:hypothetical protein
LSTIRRPINWRSHEAAIEQRAQSTDSIVGLRHSLGEIGYLRCQGALLGRQPRQVFLAAEFVLHYR